MKPQALFISALGSAMLLSAIPAHSQTTELEKMLTSSIKERVQMPLLFSTRDTAFALSLPDDEPAEVYLHVTVDRKGRVKEKLTRVNANHLGAYVAPTFADATKELRVPNETMPALTGKDTSLLLAFEVAYCHLGDTTLVASRAYEHPYRSPITYFNVISPWHRHQKAFKQQFPGTFVYLGTLGIENPYVAIERLPKPDAYSGTVSYFVAMLAE